MKKWTILENVEIEKLVLWWKWFATLKSENKDIDWKTLIITWNPIPWSIVNLKVTKNRKNYYETQIVETIKTSPIEKKHESNPYWISWWWKWINIPYKKQLEIKQNQVKESLFNIEKKQNNLVFEDIEPSPIVDWYRNKVEFSYWKYLSKKYNIEQHFNVWFHKQWEFSKVEDFDWCPLIDELQNKIYLEIKAYSKTLWLPVYDQMRQSGFFRHILIRKTHFTNEMMLLISFNPEYFEENKKLDKNEKLEAIKEFLLSLSKKYPEIKSIYFSHNPNKADTAIWDLELIYWSKTITEKLLDLSFSISPTSFFQTNSSWAEKLYSLVLNFANSKEKLREMTILDLYGWTWTIWMVFAKSWAKKVYSVELVSSASKDGKNNAKLNKIKNIEFINSKVEDFLKDYKKYEVNNWLLIIDPPRAWMNPSALEDILKFETKQIIYVSCNPATLARDLWYILDNSDYKIEKIKPVDMFPHTSHIETIVSLVKN